MREVGRKIERGIVGNGVQSFTNLKGSYFQSITLHGANKNEVTERYWCLRLSFTPWVFYFGVLCLYFRL